MDEKDNFEWEAFLRNLEKEEAGNCKAHCW